MVRSSYLTILKEEGKERTKGGNGTLQLCCMAFGEQPRILVFLGKSISSLLTQPQASLTVVLALKMLLPLHISFMVRLKPFYFFSLPYQTYLYPES